MLVRVFLRNGTNRIGREERGGEGENRSKGQEQESRGWIWRGKRERRGEERGGREEGRKYLNWFMCF